MGWYKNDNWAYNNLRNIFWKSYIPKDGAGLLFEIGNVNGALCVCVDRPFLSSESLFTIPCSSFEDGRAKAEAFVELLSGEPLKEKPADKRDPGWAPLQTGARRTEEVDGHPTEFFANDSGMLTIDFAEDRYGAQRFANRIIELLEKENDG